ncbi:MAG: hypothetical protein VKP62_08370 [Candidatus Sericytochromatia bacterium]|nr:hypothetical protein [Candidatus Sericytochromatia bacterium]
MTASPPNADEDDGGDAFDAARRDHSLRRLVADHRNEWMHRGATSLIRIGHRVPWLKELGYRAYELATRPFLRGREVKRFGAVGEGVFRGAQPSPEAFEALKLQGIQTVINLRPESDRERPWVARLGLRYIYLPLPPLDAPTHEVTLRFLEAVTDPAHGVVFFHCYHGVDRTGAMAACLRIARDEWSVEQAVEEMRAYGVHEHGQRSKMSYVQQFADYWETLPLEMHCRVLHRPLPQDLSPSPAIASAWWDLLPKRLRDWLARWQQAPGS